MQFHGMNAEDASAFAEKWLPAWSGNRPELLASFYTLDAVYSDPAIPEGVRGRDALLAYFSKLLLVQKSFGCNAPSLTGQSYSRHSPVRNPREPNREGVRLTRRCS